MAKVSRGVKARKDLVSLFHQSGNNFDLMNRKLGLDPDLAFNMLQNSLMRRNPTRNKEDLTELERALKEQKTYTRGKETIKAFKTREGEEGVMKWYHLEIGKRLPDEISRAESVSVVVHGKLRGKDKFIQSSAAVDINTALLMVGRAVKDYLGNFEAEEDGFDLKAFYYND